MFHHDKAGIRASVGMPWPENKECAWYFAQAKGACKDEAHTFTINPSWTSI